MTETGTEGRFPENRFQKSDDDVCHRLDRECSDHLAREAVAHGWKVRRQTSTYFRATRWSPGDGTVEVGVSVLNGHLKASRVEVLGESVSTDEVLDWLKEDGK